MDELPTKGLQGGGGRGRSAVIESVCKREAGRHRPAEAQETNLSPKAGWLLHVSLFAKRAERR